MNRRLALRIAGIVPSVIVASLVVFALERLIPGGPAEALAGSGATQQSLDALNRQLGLDHPVTNERIQLESPLPADLKRFWEGA